MSWSHMLCIFYLCESIKVMIDKPSGRRRMRARQSTRLPASDARLLNTREENADDRSSPRSRRRFAHAVLGDAIAQERNVNVLTIFR